MSEPEPSSPPSSASKTDVERIDGELHSVRSVFDQSGDVIYRVISPLMVEFRWRDVVQLVVGACVLAIPVAFTEEVWELGRQLPMLNVVGIVFASVMFLSLFAYYMFYQDHLRGHGLDLIKRVVADYVVTLVVAALLLTLFDKCPWSTDAATAIKRIVLVSFPACFSATVVDSLK